MTRFLSRLEKKFHIDTLHLPDTEGEIPFFDEPVQLPPPWRLLALGEKDNWFCFLDVPDYEWAIQWMWFLLPSGYAVRTRQKSDPPGPHLVYLHREVISRYDPHPHFDIMVVDHMNGCPIDNRRVNLRWATLSENAKNIHGAEWRERNIYGVL